MYPVIDRPATRRGGKKENSMFTSWLTKFTILVNMVHMDHPGSSKRELILTAAMQVFGRFGFKKSSVDDLAVAANISKQGLYLHFSSKQDVFVAAFKKYLDDGLTMVQAELSKPDTKLVDRLLGALDVWFGRHLDTFRPESFDVIEVGSQLHGSDVAEYIRLFQSSVARAIASAPEFDKETNLCTPKEIAQVIFMCGLTWKEPNQSRAEFMKKMKLAIRASCQIE